MWTAFKLLFSLQLSLKRGWDSAKWQNIYYKAKWFCWMVAKVCGKLWARWQWGVSVSDVPSSRWHMSARWRERERKGRGRVRGREKEEKRGWRLSGVVCGAMTENIHARTRMPTHCHPNTHTRTCTHMHTRAYGVSTAVNVRREMWRPDTPVWQLSWPWQEQLNSNEAWSRTTRNGRMEGCALDGLGMHQTERDILRGSGNFRLFFRGAQAHRNVISAPLKIIIIEKWKTIELLWIVIILNTF